MADNTITVVGNVTRDPELKFLNSGQAALRLAVAVTRSWNNRQTTSAKSRRHSLTCRSTAHSLRTWLTPYRRAHELS